MPALTRRRVVWQTSGEAAPIIWAAAASLHCAWLRAGRPRRADGDASRSAWTFACCVVDEARVLVCAMMVEEFGLGGLVGLCGSHRSCLASSRRQQRVLNNATTSLHACYKPHSIDIPRVYRGSIHPASDKCRPRMSSRSLFSAPTTSHEDMKTAAFQQKATLHGEQHLMAPARCLQKGSIRWNYLQHPSRRESQVAAACDSYHNRLHQGLTIMQTL